MLDAVIDYLPAPTDIADVTGTDDDEKPVTRKADDRRLSEMIAGYDLVALERCRAIGR